MKKLIKLVFVILWMIIIFLFSNQKAEESSKLSNGIIKKVAIVFMRKNLSKIEEEELIKKYGYIIRKIAHFVIYFILGILVINLLFEFDIKNIILISLLICFLYSVSDELHQTFINGRTGTVFDVFIDTVGSLFGILSFLILKKYLL